MLVPQKCRTCHKCCRVLRLLAKGHLSPYRAGGDEIYSFFRQAANWAKLLPPKHTFSISARVTSCTDIPSSNLVQIRGRDAICDSIRDARSACIRPAALAFRTLHVHVCGIFQHYCRLAACRYFSLCVVSTSTPICVCTIVWQGG